MTTKPTADQVKSWALKIAKNKTTIDMDNRYGGQCWDLPAYITIKYWGYFPPGNAIAWGYNRLPTGFKRFKNTPSFIPQPGDFAVWGTGSFNNGVGHVAIVVGPSTTSYFTSVDQNWRTNNWTGSPPYVERHSYYGISCFVRPPYRVVKQKPKAQPTTKPKVSAAAPKEEPVRVNEVPKQEDEKPKYRDVTYIKYTKFDGEDVALDNIEHFVVRGKERVGKPKGLTIKNANFMRSVRELYNDRNEYISAREYPHFFIDRHRIWSPRPIWYEVPDDPDHIVIEVCGDLNDVKNDFIQNEVTALTTGVYMLELVNMTLKESTISIDPIIWRSLKEHIGFDTIKDGDPTKSDMNKLITELLKIYKNKDKILYGVPKDVVTKKKIKVTRPKNETVKTSTATPVKTSDPATTKAKTATKAVKNMKAKKSEPTITIEKSPYTLSQALNAQMRWNPQVSNGYSWYSASSTQTRNAMNTSTIQNSSVQRYQMLNLGKHQGISPSKLNQILRGKGKLSGQGQAFYDGSKKYNVNEIYLIAHAILETGNGSSYFASGASGYYNMFGIGAFDSNPNNAVNFARNQGWNTPSKAIVGGAKFVRQNYIAVGQNTLYRMRWNPKRPATHQYATDINWCKHQATTIYNIYKKIGSKGMYYIYDRYK